MKGKAIITLRDAKSGAIISRKEETNMVTNAVKNIFSPPQLAMYSNWNMSGLLKGCLPMYKTLFGGILLLGDTMEENEDNIILPPKANILGHAGGAYAGTNVFRGSLNTNECYETDNGYHFAWDFPTDKGNGKIRCIALTNRLFGNVGIESEATGDGTMIFDPYSPSTYTIDTRTYIESAQNGIVAGSFSKNTFLRVFVAGNIVTLRTVIFPDSSGLLINDDPTSPRYTEDTVELPEKVDEYGRFFVNSDENRIYFFALQLNGRESTTVKYYGIDIDKPHLITEGGVTVPYFNVSRFTAAVYKGQLYVMTDAATKIYGEDGTVLKTLDITYDAFGRFFVIEGDIFLSYTQNTHHYYANLSREEVPRIFAQKMRVCPTTSFKPPYVMCDYTDAAYKSTPMCMCLSTYMATINNLAEPIEKTSSQTLKVEYVIEN